MTPDADDLVTLAICGYQEAVLLRSVLMADGIEAFLPDWHVFNNVIGACFNLTVLVRRSDLERARELLAALRQPG
jgi:hypothetical protein